MANYWLTAEALKDVTPRDDRYPEGDVAAILREEVGPTESVLDFGCGDGRLVAAFESWRYFGVDVNQHAIKRCMYEYPHYKFALAGDPLPSADVALAWTVLLHIPDDEIDDVARRLVEAAPRVLIVEIMDRVWRRPNGAPPCFNRAAEDYGDIFRRYGARIFKTSARPYNRYGGTLITFLDLRR